MSVRDASCTLELDSTTSHHLYADFLRDRYPRAVFVHTIRDVASWTTSLLDMVLRQRIARARTHELRAVAPRLSALAGGLVQTLRLDLSHANRDPVALDRFATFDSPARREQARQMWAEHHERTTEWVVAAISQHAPQTMLR